MRMMTDTLAIPFGVLGSLLLRSLLLAGVMASWAGLGAAAGGINKTLATCRLASLPSS